MPCLSATRAALKRRLATSDRQAQVATWSQRPGDEKGLIGPTPRQGPLKRYSEPLPLSSSGHGMRYPGWVSPALAAMDRRRS